jgi:hypothetical protein
MRRALLLILLVSSCAPWRDVGARFGGSTTSIDRARVFIGDDARFADPKFDDTRWPERFLYDTPQQEHWIRAHVNLRGENALYVGMVGSYEVFLDGQRIGGGGPIDSFFVIDKRGPQVLAIHILTPGASLHGIAIGDHAQMIRSRVVAQLVPLSALGVFIVIGVYYLSIWFAASRRASLLVFALLCFTASLLVIAETWRWLVGYDYHLHILRMHVVLVLTLAIAFLLPLFFVLELSVARARFWAAATAVVLIGIAMRDVPFDTRCLQLFAVSIGISAAAILLSIRSRKWEALPSLIGTAIVGVALLTGGYGFSDSSFFLAFCALIVCLLLSLTLQMRRQRREHESAMLRAARLEIELLKKSIQPHFLMNTLTAVMEWIEESPREGVRFLEALADELRIFAEVAGEPLIPARRELELCRSHLAIMSCRKGTRFALDAEGVDANATLPPAIFHTLIENAITHNSYDEADVVFTLREERTKHARRYVLDAPARHDQPANAGAGLGLRYIKARLEESFPGRWSVESAPFASSWRTIIEVAS